MLHAIHLIFLNIRAHQMIILEEEDNEESLKLFNSQKREYNE